MDTNLKACSSLHGNAIEGIGDDPFERLNCLFSHWIQCQSMAIVLVRW